MKCNYFLLRETTITALAVTSVELRVTLQTFPYTQYKIYEQLGICFDIIMNIIVSFIFKNSLFQCHFLLYHTE